MSRRSLGANWPEMSPYSDLHSSPGGAGTFCKQDGSGDWVSEYASLHSYFVSFWDVEFNETIDFIGVF
jgi:hypothetical protein